jgi:hypothetical protein
MAFRTQENRKIRPSVGCGENSVPSTVVRGYDRKSHVGTLDQALDQADANGWIIVDMKKDWKSVLARR